MLTAIPKTALRYRGVLALANGASRFYVATKPYITRRTPRKASAHGGCEPHHGQAPIASATTLLRAVTISATVIPGRRVTAPKRKLCLYSGWNNRPGIGVSR